VSEKPNVELDSSLAVFEEHITAEISKETETLLERSHNAAADRLKKAECEAQSYRERVLADARKRSEIERKKLLSRARLEIRREELQMKEDIIQKVFASSIRRVREMRGSEDYRTLLLGLVTEAVIGIESSEVDLFVSDDDIASITQEFLDDVWNLVSSRESQPPQISVRGISELEDFDDLIGAVVESGDGRIVYNNSLRTRIERREHQLRKLVSDILFENEGASS